MQKGIIETIGDQTSYALQNHHHRNSRLTQIRDEGCETDDVTMHAMGLAQIGFAKKFPQDPLTAKTGIVLREMESRLVIARD